MISALMHSVALVAYRQVFFSDVINRQVLVLVLVLECHRHGCMCP